MPVSRGYVHWITVSESKPLFALQRTDAPHVLEYFLLWDSEDRGSGLIASMHVALLKEALSNGLRVAVEHPEDSAVIQKVTLLSPMAL